MLLRVAAKLTRGSRVGSYVVHQARTPTIRTSYLGSGGRAATLSRDVSVRVGRRHHRPTYGTAQLLRQDAGFDDEGGGSQRVDERGRDGFNSPRASISVFQIRTASTRSIAF